MNIHPKNKTLLRSLEKRYYYDSVKEFWREFVAQHGAKNAGDHLTEAMRALKPIIEKRLLERQSKGEIKNVDQARKSLAGNIFQVVVALALIHMQDGGLIPRHVAFTLSPKNHQRTRDSATVHVGEEALQPDMDLLAFSEKPGNETLYIFSMKTSLRERAGQTQRWKLMHEIATAKNSASIKMKYQLRYEGESDFKMALITTNFYDEINAPQHRGAFAFLDGIYITKPGHFEPPVSNFSCLADDLRKVYDND